MRDEKLKKIDKTKSLTLSLFYLLSFNGGLTLQNNFFKKQTSWTCFSGFVSWVLGFCKYFILIFVKIDKKCV